MTVTGDDQFKMDSYHSATIVNSPMNIHELWLQDHSHKFVIGLAGMVMINIVRCDDNH